MELKIYNPTEDGFIKAIEWNHEEIKKEVSEKVSYYKNLVYTDDQIKDAKADRAVLNKFVTALEDKRKEIKKQCLAPYESFEKQMKEIIAIVNEPIALIDTQVKEYQEKQKQDKMNSIKALWTEMEVPDGLKFEKVFDERMLNVSYGMNHVKQKMFDDIKRFNRDLETLSNLPEFGFEAVEVYKSTLDINKAIAEAKRMSEIARKKAEKEAEAKARAEEQARLAAEAEAKKQEEVVANAMNPPVEEVAKTEEVVIPPATPVKQWVSFSALLSTEDAVALKEFFNSRNIEFRAV